MTAAPTALSAICLTEHLDPTEFTVPEVLSALIELFLDVLDQAERSQTETLIAAAQERFERGVSEIRAGNYKDDSPEKRVMM